MSGAARTPGATLAAEITITGVGLHTGAEVRVALRPRREAGVWFVREDLPGRPRLRAGAHSLVFELRRTVLRDGAAEVHTAEHLLAVLFVLGVDAVEIGVWGPEIPGLDGSARPWLEAIERGGIVPRGGPRRRLTVTTALAETGGAAAIAAVPHRGGLTIDYVLDHDSLVLPVQRVAFPIDRDTFAREIAPARTFVLEEEVAGLLAAGLGRGASEENTLVMGPGGARGTALRFPDECARHKVLDLLGDLSLVDAALDARVVAVRSGHGLNAALVQRLAALEGGGGD